MDIQSLTNEVLSVDFGTQLNEEGYATFEYSGVPVLVQSNPEEKCVVLYAIMGKLPHHGAEAVALSLLGTNLTLVYGFGAHFAYDQEQREILLCVHIGESEAVHHYVCDAFRSFAEMAAYHRARLEPALKDSLDEIDTALLPASGMIII